MVVEIKIVARVASETIVDQDVIEILAVAGEDALMIVMIAIIVEDEIVIDAAIDKFV